MTKAASAHKGDTFKLDVRGAYLRRTNLSQASLRGANLSRADLSNAILQGADFKDAILDGTILRGADLTDAKNLTIAQLRKAVIDITTRLPNELSMSDVTSESARTDG